MPPDLHSTEPCPPRLPPPQAPKGARFNPPLLFDNTAKYRAQDEAKLRSRTLNLWLSFQRKPLIYAIYGTTRRFRHYLLCSHKLRLHLEPGCRYDAPYGRGQATGRRPLA
jgi:hypothetical protein